TPTLRVRTHESQEAGGTHCPTLTFMGRVLALAVLNLLVAGSAFAGRPSSPSSLTATAISSSQIKLTWTDRSSIELGFKIDRALSSTGPWTINIATVGPNVTVYTDSGLNPATKYYYRVYDY